ncbi:hypothetical protein SAMN05444955_103305 [Lihuaxuella thermophila]|uniref:Uncharacterized protein n=1 Tax=Lihuaxuella thermophila TaxID=1173111 RepID=A0A1H8CH60_9BACL|nr:hypothetical protein SAMN05444955_103305 [Lihuaxuella thermophila]
MRRSWTGSLNFWRKTGRINNFFSRAQNGKWWRQEGNRSPISPLFAENGMVQTLYDKWRKAYISGKFDRQDQFDFRSDPVQDRLNSIHILRNSGKKRPISSVSSPLNSKPLLKTGSEVALLPFETSTSLVMELQTRFQAYTRESKISLRLNSAQAIDESATP